MFFKHNRGQKSRTDHSLPYWSRFALGDRMQWYALCAEMKNRLFARINKGYRLQKGGWFLGRNGFFHSFGVNLNVWSAGSMVKYVKERVGKMASRIKHCRVVITHLFDRCGHDGRTFFKKMTCAQFFLGWRKCDFCTRIVLAIDQISPLSLLAITAIKVNQGKQWDIIIQMAAPWVVKCHGKHIKSGYLKICYTLTLPQLLKILMYREGPWNKTCQ